jgi:hypothetical protein
MGTLVLARFGDGVVANVLLKKSKGEGGRVDSKCGHYRPGKSSAQGGLAHEEYRSADIGFIRVREHIMHAGNSCKARLDPYRDRPRSR